MHEEAQEETGIVLRTVSSMQGFERTEWAQFSTTQKQADSLEDRNRSYNPFLSYAYLSALEDSGCVGENTGWLPYHLRLETAQGQLLAAAPAYLKSHSQGEYVFDHGWAEAFERAGGQYYPKLQLGVPFTPATGSRLLVADKNTRLLVADKNPELRQLLGSAIAQITDQHGLSSAHVTFAESADIQALKSAGFLHRTDQQFHFINNGFQDYNDFLEELISRKRKALKRERREALSNGISIDWLTGKDLTEDIWDQFFTFYMDTGSRKWGRPYLNRDFYSLIGERMADDIVLIMAKREDRYIAGAINFIGGDRLFGRHWGCIEDHPFLHFEVCYHQAIDYAIAHQLSVVEAGAQGEHKLARGYEPVTTHSAHYISNPSFRTAVAQYLRREMREIEQNNVYFSEHSPFRKILQGITE